MYILSILIYALELYGTQQHILNHNILFKYLLKKKNISYIKL